MTQLELFKGIPFFDAFSEELLRAILPQVERRSFADGASVLEQGALNLDLYFLLSGAVDVLVDRQHVVTIDRRGEVFGEMSIADHTTCTASVRAKGDATLMVLNFEELKRTLSGQERETVLKHFYQATAEILAKKLISTNQIAKSYKALHGAR